MTNIPPPDAPIRKAARPETLCATCKKILRVDCRDRYQRQIELVGGFVVISQCSGYEVIKEQPQ